MAIPPHWPETLPLRPSNRGFTESAQDGRAVFEPETGPTITRPRVTEQIIMQSVTFPPLPLASAQIVRDFYGTTLKRGALAFAWRDPVTLDPRLYKLMDLPRVAGVGAQHVQVSMTVMRLPGVPWFAPYVAEGSARVPDWVADYRNSRYWVNGLPVAATGLSAVSGSYLVLEQRLTLTRNWLTETYSGDVPQTAPDAQVDFLAGFSV